MRVLAIALMCATMVCFTGQDTCAKWLSTSLPIVQIVWARYVGASVVALIASRSLSRPPILRSRRPRLQLLRSVLLFVATTANVFAVRELQLSETATISFLTALKSSSNKFALIAAVDLDGLTTLDAVPTGKITFSAGPDDESHGLLGMISAK